MIHVREVSYGHGPSRAAEPTPFQAFTGGKMSVAIQAFMSEASALPRAKDLKAVAAIVAKLEAALRKVKDSVD